jgi:type 1 glutamine amidotransferase
MKILPAFLTVVFAAITSLCAADAPPKPLRALMVCGGCCHDYTAQKKILSEGISARANVEWTIVHEDAPKGGDAKNHRISIYEKPDWWKGFDVVLHNECFGVIDDNAFVEGIAAAHKAGVPAVMLHCSSHSYRMASTDEWRMCVGITSRSHEKNRDLLVKNILPEHPVMKGFPAEWKDPADELYKNEKIWPTATPLAQSYGEDTKKEHVNIWVNTYGKAKVFSTTLGHDAGPGVSRPRHARPALVLREARRRRQASGWLREVAAPFRPRADPPSLLPHPVLPEALPVLLLLRGGRGEEQDARLPRRAAAGSGGRSRAARAPAAHALLRRRHAERADV